MRSAIAAAGLYVVWSVLAAPARLRPAPILDFRVERVRHSARMVNTPLPRRNWIRRLHRGLHAAGEDGDADNSLRICRFAPGANSCGPGEPFKF